MDTLISGTELFEQLRPIVHTISYDKLKEIISLISDNIKYSNDIDAELNITSFELSKPEKDVLRKKGYYIVDYKDKSTIKIAIDILENIDCKLKIEN